MAEGTPPSPPGEGDVRPRTGGEGQADAVAGPPPPHGAARPSRPLSTPAVLSIALVVLAGTSGTVLIARNAGGPSDTTGPIGAVPLTSTPSPQPARTAAPPAAPPATATPSLPPPAFTPSAATRRPGPTTPQPTLSGSPPPLPTYAGPTPETLLSGPTPPPTPSASRVTPDKLAFGSTPSGRHSTQQQVVVVNDGGQALHVFPTGINGDNAGDFRIVSDSCSSATVQPAGQCVVSIAYYPRTAGDSKAALLISDDSGGSPSGGPTKTSSVPLTGSSG